MTMIPNKWIKKDKPKLKSESKITTDYSHIPTITRPNMVKTLRGVRK